MTSLVPVTELAREIGPFDTDETTLAESYLSEASELAREIGNAKWTEAAGANPAPVSVRLAVKRAARRAFNEDPEGLTQEALGDWSGRKAATDLDESGVYFTASEERRIAKAAGFRSGVGSVRTPSAYGYDNGLSTVYVPVASPAYPFPLLDEEDLLP